MIGVIRKRTFCQKGEIYSFTAYKKLYQLKMLSDNSGRIYGKDVIFSKKVKYVLRFCFHCFRKLFELKMLSSNGDRSNMSKNVIFAKKAKYVLHFCFYCFRETL